MKTSTAFWKTFLLAIFAGFAFPVLSTGTADSGLITFQEGSDASPESASALIGHWRKTTIGYTGPKDEHLVLHSDGRLTELLVP